MKQLKNALEKLDGSIDRLENALDSRLNQIDGQLRDARNQVDQAALKSKTAGKIGERLDQIIDEITGILQESE